MEGNEESQIQRIVRELQETIGEISQDYSESSVPVMDDSQALHRFSTKFEYLLQFDQKEKKGLLGTRKDYWDYFCDCLAKQKGANEGIRFVRSISELRTALGRGRALIRYWLVHQRLADSLQRCLLQQNTTRDCYGQHSPLVCTGAVSDLIVHLYDLNAVQFDLAPRGHDLDAEWPTFARRSFGNSLSPASLWHSPSRGSSMGSLASSFFPQSPEPLSQLDGSMAEHEGLEERLESLQLERDSVELQLRAAESARGRAEERAKQWYQQAAILTHENTRLLNDLQLLRNPKGPCDIDISPMQNTNENSLPSNCTHKLVKSTTIGGPVIPHHSDKIAVSDASTQTNHCTQLMDACGLQVEDSTLQLSGNITAELQQNWIQQMALVLQDQNQKDGILDVLLESNAEQKPAAFFRNAGDYLVPRLNDEVQRLKQQLADENVSCQQAEQAASMSTEAYKNKELAEGLHLQLNALEWVVHECRQMQKELKMAEVRAQEALQKLKSAETELKELRAQLKTMEENCAVTLSQRRADEEIQEQLRGELTNVSAELERRDDKASIEIDHPIGHEGVLHCTAVGSPNGWRKRAEKAEERLKLLQDSTQQEFSALRFHTSSEVLGYQDQLQESNINAKRHEDKIEELKRVLVDKDSEIFKLKNEIEAFEVEVERLDSVDVELNSERVAKSALENECSTLQSDVQRLQEVEKEGKWQRKDLQEHARQAEKTADNLHSEVQELKETMNSMSDRLVELLRDKDVLWQKSDMLEFEQRLRAEERFEQGDSASQCLDCRSTFSWMLRRHSCRFCRRPFCYYCCNNPIPGREGVSKERCCKSCYGIYAPASPTSSSQPGSPCAEHGQAPPAPDDIAFDIITEDELDQSLSDLERSDEAQVGCSQSLLSNEVEHKNQEETSRSPSSWDSVLVLLQDFEPVTVQRYSLKELCEFGHLIRELFVRAGCYALVLLELEEANFSLAWEFSSEHRNIGFSVVFRGDEERALDQARVLIQLMRCNSHRQAVRGQLNAREPGTYLLVFDNSFSRFYGKKVFYHLVATKMVLYDGTD
uniref:FYVE and coiled-coil domain-containing protein 1-like isoform X2 n=1 Tax=Myxine glutinosa TaxID=7769 RepID=UPI00358FB0D0